MLLLVFLNRRDSVFSLGINLHIQQHQANKRQPVNICSSINKQFILMKAHLIFAMRMVYSFINTKTLKEVPFHTPSKMLLHQFNMFTVWLWIIFQSHLLSLPCWSYTLATPTSACSLNPPGLESFTYCTLLLIFQNQSPLPWCFKGELILVCASHRTMFQPPLPSETDYIITTKSL